MVLLDDNDHTYDYVVEMLAKLFGYPTIAIVWFLAAVLAGVWLILTSLMHDLPQRRRRQRHR